jgi:hypothetical protein
LLWQEMNVFHLFLYGQVMAMEIWKMEKSNKNLAHFL